MLRQCDLIVTGFLGFVLVSSASAATVIDDHFTGTDVGVPPGWSVASNAQSGGSYDDTAATTVRLRTEGLFDSAAILVNDTFFNPQDGATWTVEIESVDGNANNIFSGFANGDFSWNLTSSNSTLSAINANTQESIFFTMPSPYANSAVDVVTAVSQAGFQISLSSGFDTGFQPWSVFTTGYQLSDAGTIAGITIGASVSTFGANLHVDRVVVDATLVPEPLSMPLVLLGGLIGLARRSRA